MKKEFKKVSDIEKKCKKAFVFMAGIAFILFGCTDCDTQNEFSFAPSAKNERIEKSAFELPEGVVTLHSNEETTSDKIERGFLEFCSKNEAVYNTLEPVCRFVSMNIGNVKADCAMVDGNVQEGLLNVSLKLIDGAILSINKRIDTIGETLVAFNIFKDRKLLISDIMDIRLLSHYIQNVQNAMSNDTK